MKPQSVTRSVFSSIVIPAILELILSVGLLGLSVQAGPRVQGSQAAACYDWSELIASMDKMHMSMSAVARSGNSDVDFVRLMLPHHQAAIDMAKTELFTARTPKCEDSHRKLSQTSNSKLN